MHRDSLVTWLHSTTMKNSSPLRWILLAIALLVPALGAGTILIRHAIRRRRQVQAVSTEHNVQSPKNEHSPYSLGISKIREMVRQYQSQTLLDYATRLFHQLGDTYVSRVVGMDVVFTRDPDNIKHILQRRFDDFEIGPLRRHLFAAVNPDGIFGFDGGEWRSRRKLFRVHFADTRAVVDLDTVESHVQLLIQRIPADGGSVDIQQLFVALMTDVLGTLAGGESIHALSEERTDDEKELDGALTFVKDNIAKMGMSRPSSLLSDTLGFRRSGAIIRKYMEKLVCKAARENAEQAKLGETSEKAYRRSFIHGSVYDEHSLSMVRDQAASIYLAGIESVAALLSAAFRFLAQDERVFQNLRGVILDRFGADARPEYDELTSIPYLRHVLNECEYCDNPVGSWVLTTSTSLATRSPGAVQCQNSRQGHLAAPRRRSRRNRKHIG